MKKIGLLSVAMGCTFLTACALTPQQKTELAQEKALKRLELQVQMARQCDPEAAQLMAQLPTVGKLDPAQRATFNKEYQAHVNNPTFKSCYNLAFKAYSEQQQLNLEQLDWDANQGWFNNMPFNCEFAQPEGPFWGTC